MKKLVIVALISMLALAGYARAADWSNPHPQAGGDMAGQLLLKHELNFSDLYTSTTGKLNILKNNSAGGTSPSGPGTGQSWYDTTNQCMKFYDTTWGGGGLCSSGTFSVTGGLSTSGTTTFSGTTAVTGTATFTGAVSFSSPFTMLSTTVVTSLNADMVDGSHATSTPTGTSIPVADSTGKIASGWLPDLSTIYTTATFTGTGVWTAPSGVTEAWLFLRGGGGGGAGAGNGNGLLGGGGGEAGQILNWHRYPVVSGATYTVTVGAKGTGGAVATDGTNGGTTSIIKTDGTNTVSITGGTKGISGSTTGAAGTSTPTIVSSITTTSYVGYGLFLSSSIYTGTTATGGTVGNGGNGGGIAGGSAGTGCTPGCPGIAGGAATEWTGSGGGGGGSGIPGAAGGNGADGYAIILYFKAGY